MPAGLTSDPYQYGDISDLVYRGPPEAQAPRPMAKGTSQRLGESLRKMYKIATLPTEEAVAFKKEAGLSDFETVMGGLVGRILSLPYRLIKETGDMASDVMEGALALRAPMGEAGQYTPEQEKVATEATMLAALGVGAGGGSAAPGAIGRGEAYKMLAKDFRALMKAPKSAQAKLAEGTLSPQLKKVVGEDITQTIREGGEVYRELARGLKHIPKEVLDPVKEVRLFRGGGSKYGAFGPESKKVSASISQPKEQALGSLGHEFFHSEQLVKHPEFVKRLESVRPLLEEHAYAAEKGFVASVKALPKGERITKQAFDAIYKAGLKGLKERKLKAYTEYRKGQKELIGQDVRSGLFKEGKVTHIDPQKARLVQGLKEIGETLRTGEIKPMAAPRKWLDEMKAIYTKSMREAEKKGDIAEQVNMLRHIKGLEKHFYEAGPKAGKLLGFKGGR